jgi:uncharacterized protein (DUF1501 family)
MFFSGRNHALSRRRFLKLGCRMGAAALLAGSLPQLAFASVPTGKRLVLVFLRGGLDSLSAVVPYADPHYKSVRGELAYAARDEQLIPVTDFFALHGNLKTLAELYKKEELAVVHAVASPYRERSHFDAQDLLENGTNAAHQLKTGWLNRTIAAMGGSTLSPGLALGASVPLSLRGDAKVMSWSPSALGPVGGDLMQRIAALYQYDPLLGEALQTATENQDIAGSVTGRWRLAGNKAFIGMMQVAATFLDKPDGPRIAAVDFNGFDTHVRQQGKGTAGRLPSQLKGLDDGIRAFREKLSEPAWRNTVIYVVTEFGRTVRPNGSGGTDHGTASLAMVIGGAVQGGRIVTQWPGLADARLYDGRDLLPTTDLRAVSKGILMTHYQISSADIGRQILPGTADLAAVPVLRG